MKRSSTVYKKLFFVFGFLFGAVFLLSSCVTVATDQDIMALNDQVVLLNNRINALQDSLGKRDASLSKELAGSVDAQLRDIRGNLAGVVAETDSIKEELGILTGKVEENTHLARNVIERDTSQEDMMRTAISDLKMRVEKLEKSIKDVKDYLGLASGVEHKGASPGGEETARPKISPEKARYDHALAVYHAGKFEEAIGSFKEFIKAFPKSELADNAQFWIGECYMSLKEYEQAILAYQQVIKRYPKGNKVPSAMLRQSLAFQAINDNTSAKLLLKRIIKNYPNSNEAGIAKTKMTK